MKKLVMTIAAAIAVSSAFADTRTAASNVNLNIPQILSVTATGNSNESVQLTELGGATLTMPNSMFTVKSNTSYARFITFASTFTPSTSFTNGVGVDLDRYKAAYEVNFNSGTYYALSALTPQGITGTPFYSASLQPTSNEGAEWTVGARVTPTMQMAPGSYKTTITVTVTAN